MYILVDIVRNSPPVFFYHPVQAEFGRGLLRRKYRLQPRNRSPEASDVADPSCAAVSVSARLHHPISSAHLMGQHECQI